MLFSIYLNGLFFLTKGIDVCNSVDDTTTFICDHSYQNVLNSLEENVELAICWFENNYIKLTTDKCHLLIVGFKYEAIKKTQEKTHNIRCNNR